MADNLEPPGAGPDQNVPLIDQDRIRQPYSRRLTIAGLVQDLAAFHGNIEAVVDESGRLSYHDLDTTSARLAQQLLALGLGKGSRIGILVPNGIDWLTIFVAAGRIGAVVLPLSTLAQAPELAWVVREAGIELLVTAPAFRGHDYLDRLEEALPGLDSADSKSPLFLRAAPRLRNVVVTGDATRPWSTVLPAPGVDRDFLAAVEAGVAAHDPLVIIHTSGSTADPKGVIHSQGGFVGHTGNMARDYVPQSAGDRLCSPRPWFWVAGLAADLFYALHSGSTTVVPSDGSAAIIADLVERERLHYVGGSMPLFRQVSGSSSLASVELIPLGIDLAGIAERTGGAEEVRFRSEALEAHMPAVQARNLDPARFPNLFGMTEAIGSHSALPHCTQVPEGREGTSGPPVPGMERRVLDLATGEDVEPGEDGELLIRGTSLMLGFDRRDPREVFDESGWYATGDVCHRDADGWITFRSRLGDMVKISGANVAPLEVERAMYRQGQVEEAAVVGIESASGMVLTAFVVPIEGETLDTADLQAWLRTQLSSYKVPKRIEVIGREDMRRTASGKIRKHELQDRARGS
jgi:acyl-coenzyme A synthetase/AMP-(fatty) acid ligase